MIFVFVVIAVIISFIASEARKGMSEAAEGVGKAAREAAGAFEGASRRAAERAQYSGRSYSAVTARRAVVVAKRTEVSSNTVPVFTGNGFGLGSSPETGYYVTFELESGDREELKLHGRQYGILAVGDVGLLRTNGKIFISFVRTDDAFTAEDPDTAFHTCPSCGAPYQGRVCDYCGTPWDARKNK